MNILILGSGGREHALTWKLARSEKTGKIFIAPGNSGTSLEGKNVKLDPGDFNQVAEFALREEVGMVIVGPEAPLVNGIHDYFLKNNKYSSIPVVGPVKAAAMLEGSKDFAKDFMQRYAIPTAKYRSFTGDSFDEACDYLKNMSKPYVLKADGLAAGKGVLILDNYREAVDELQKMFSGKFGDAGSRV
ncbi:MAG TPA: hypothetical protein VJ877_07810, partial [Bacteroidales bacterium]|nr:hypothetical protein [Bacteroidales bacterium]